MTPFFPKLIFAFSVRGLDLSKQNVHLKRVVSPSLDFVSPKTEEATPWWTWIVVILSVLWSSFAGVDANKEVGSLFKIQVSIYKTLY